MGYAVLNAGRMRVSQVEGYYKSVFKIWSPWNWVEYGKSSVKTASGTLVGEKCEWSVKMGRDWKQDYLLEGNNNLYDVAFKAYS